MRAPEAKISLLRDGTARNRPTQEVSRRNESDQGIVGTDHLARSTAEFDGQHVSCPQGPVDCTVKSDRGHAAIRFAGQKRKSTERSSVHLDLDSLAKKQAEWRAQDQHLTLAFGYHRERKVRGSPPLRLGLTSVGTADNLPITPHSYVRDKRGIGDLCRRWHLGGSTAAPKTEYDENRM
jgi:hypothetical protein